MKSYVLTVDVGNTSVSLGLYRDGHVSRKQRLETRKRSAEEIRKVIRRVVEKRDVRGAVLGSVVPGANKKWVAAIKDTCGVRAVVVTHKLKLAVKLSYPKPERIGADRLANACGAAIKYGTPAIVADFGTALTFDVISSTQGYIGGIIAPGLPLMCDYLAEKTALLPHVDPGGAVRRAVGKSTEEAIRIGARWGYLGMVREILGRVKQEIGAGEVHVCATGGYASWVLRGLDEPVAYDQDLTLYGLAQIYELNT